MEQGLWRCSGCTTSAAMVRRFNSRVRRAGRSEERIPRRPWDRGARMILSSWVNVGYLLSHIGLSAFFRAH